MSILLNDFVQVQEDTVKPLGFFSKDAYGYHWFAYQENAFIDGHPDYDSEPAEIIDLTKEEVIEKLNGFYAKACRDYASLTHAKPGVYMMVV